MSLQRIRAGWAGMPGRIEVFTSPANGNRPVLVYLPPGCDLSKPVRVITMFHGRYGTLASTFGEHGWLDRIRDVTEPSRRSAAPGADQQTIYVVPQAAAESSAYDCWMARPESIAALDREARAKAAELGDVSTINVSARIVEAHSGGGLAIANAIAGGELDADKVNLLDATYHDWGSTVASYALDERAKGHDVRVESWFTNHEEMVEHNAAMRDLAKGDPGAVLTHDVTAETHYGVPTHHMGTN